MRFQLSVIAFLASLVPGLSLVGGQKKDCCEKTPQGPKPQIISAVENCDVETVTRLIRNGASIESKDDEGNTLLKYAIEKKCESLVDHLLKSGANPNSPSMYGRTPFMSAVSSGSVELVQRLIAKGCDVNFKDKFRQPALFYANELDIGQNPGRSGCRCECCGPYQVDAFDECSHGLR